MSKNTQLIVRCLADDKSFFAGTYDGLCGSRGSWYCGFGHVNFLHFEFVTDFDNQEGISKPLDSGG